MKLVVILPLLLAAQLFGAEFKKQGGEYVYRDTLRFDESVLELKTLACESVNGTITLTGEDRGTVSVVAFIEIRSDKLDEGQEYLAGFKPIVKREGDKLRIYGEYPETKFSWNDISGGIDFVINAPKQLELDASCANGSITSVGMMGGADLESANGEISFLSRDGVTGAIDASCANGRISIDVAELSDDSEFSTANGEISVIVHKALAGNISASTANGEIVLALPENSSMKVSASSLVNGSISSEWSDNHKFESIDEGFELVVDKGRYLVECSTVNGEITIRKANRAN